MQLKFMGWLLLALICGISCSVVVKKVFFSSKNTVAIKEISGPTAKVLVAKYEIPAGNDFTAQNIRYEVVPEKSVPRDAIFTTEGILGRRAMNSIPKDAILTLFDVKMLQEKSKNDISFVPPGYSVVPIKIEAVKLDASGTDLSESIHLDEVLYKGDKVDLSVIHSVRSNDTKDASHALPKLVTKSLVQNVSVYKIFTEKRLDNNNLTMQRFTIISLLLEDKNVKQLKLASNTGKIFLNIAGVTANVDQENTTVPGNSLQNTQFETTTKPTLSTFKEDTSPTKKTSVEKPVLISTPGSTSSLNDHFSFGITLDKPSGSNVPMKEEVILPKLIQQNNNITPENETKKKSENKTENMVEDEVPGQTKDIRKVTLHSTSGFANFNTKNYGDLKKKEIPAINVNTTTNNSSSSYNGVTLSGFTNYVPASNTKSSEKEIVEPSKMPPSSMNSKTTAQLP